MGSGDGTQTLGQVGHGVVPTHGVPSAVGVAQCGVIQTVGVVVQVDRGQALVTGEPIRHRMVSMWCELLEAAQLDMRDQATRWFTDTTERLDFPHALSVRARRFPCVTVVLAE